MKVIGMLLVRNEADRWLRPVLEQVRYLSDYLVVVDDASTDATPEICREYADEMHETATSLFRTGEYVQRQRMWDAAKAHARRGDWIVTLAADELFSTHDLEQFKQLMTMRALPDVDSIAFRLYDMWSESHYRDDKYWTAHHRFWTRAVRFNPAGRHDFLQKAQHCGTWPVDAEGVIGNTDLRIKHLGWSRHEDRIAKHAAYLAADPEGKMGWLEQYHSILDEAPNLVPFPDAA